MTKIRQDAWSHEDDLLLAETVLRHIREGGTQLNAFEEVGDRLDRTGAACGFRWNAIVRKKYEQAVSIAKRQRKHMKRSIINKPNYEENRELSEPVPFSLVESFKEMTETEAEPVPAPINQTPQFNPALLKKASLSEPMNLTKVIEFLKTLDVENLNQSRWAAENERLRKDLKRVEEENASLKNERAALYAKQQTVEEDYQSLIQIMDRARKMVLFQENETINPASSPSFKMDKNGNLEKIAK